MKKPYTEAKIANALRSVVHRVPIFWLGGEHKVELARLTGKWRQTVRFQPPRPADPCSYELSM
ncbi:MAG: hypothetical protein JSV55_04930 [Deltaproteobacteria bacterium]|nr:MAG: hypothetical protein JSV55_04930 [Deltaproteobacteria bacterium]